MKRLKITKTKRSTKNRNLRSRGQYIALFWALTHVFIKPYRSLSIWKCSSAEIKYSSFIQNCRSWKPFQPQTVQNLTQFFREEKWISKWNMPKALGSSPPCLEIKTLSHEVFSVKRPFMSEILCGVKLLEKTRWMLYRVIRVAFSFCTIVLYYDVNRSS